MTKPLAGIRVLDMTRVLAGPWATQLLADLGAEVVKVEQPGHGDETRSWGPPWATGPDGAREASYFLSANRGKKSVAIDIATPEGTARVRALAADSDVYVENFKVGGLEKYGLDCAALRAAHPRLITCSITGYGQDGPYADRPGYDFIMQAMGGLMSLTGETEGEAMRAGVAVTDVFTGMYAASGIMAALLKRERTGEGSAVDVALFDVQVATLANQALGALVTGRAPKRHGNAHASIAPYQTFGCADGVIAVAAANDGQYRRLCGILGAEALAAHPDYASNELRVTNREALIAALEPMFASLAVAPLVDRLNAEGVPAGPVNDLPAMFADPHLIARGIVGSAAHATLGSVPTVACPLRFDGAPLAPTSAPPALGQHNDEILG